MATRVNTLRGPVDPTSLGATLMHEHVFVRSIETTANYSTTWVSDDVRVADAVSTLTALEAAGISTIVDLTVLGLGRDIPLIARVAEQVNLNIVAATGAYVLDRFPYQWGFNPPTVRGSVSAGLAEWFVRDILEGIAGTSVRAGAIKCATDVAGLTDDVVTTLEAVSLAHIATGVSIITHADAATRRGLDQQRLLSDRGVDLERVVIGHAGDTTDLDYLKRLMDAGSTIGMDRFGMESPVSTDERVRVVAELCALGYADRMVLSQDAACHSEWMDSTRSALENPSWSLFFISQSVIPALVERGVAAHHITTMLELNPKRLLAIADDAAQAPTKTGTQS